MSLRDLKGRHLRLIFSYNIRNGLRLGSAILFAYMALMVGLFIAHFFFSRLTMAQTALQASTRQKVSVEMVINEAKNLARPAANSLLNQDEKFVKHLLDDNPAVLSAIYLVVIFMIPYLVPLGSFNQVSGDIQSKGLRYVVIRTERANVFFGRFFGTLVFCTLIMLLILLTIYLYAGGKTKIYSFKDAFPISLHMALALVFLTMPFVALGSWISARIASPFLSLSVVSMIVMATPIIAAIGRSQWEPLGYIAYLIPWPFKFELLHPDFMVQMKAMALCVLYTVIYLALGYRTFSRRDL